MDSFKNLVNNLTTFPRNLSSSWSKSRTHSTIILLVTIALFFFFSASDTSPTTTTNTTNLTSGLHSATTLISSLPSMLSSNTHLVYNSSGTCSVTAKGQVCHQNVSEIGEVGNDISSCDIFDGQWIADGSGPLYLPGSCPFIDDSFNCFNNGRTDSGYLKLRWKPHGCHIPRFDGLKMLEMLRGKRVVFVGDSLNRNMWESLVCALRASLYNKSRVFEASGRRQFRTQGFYSFRFKDYRCSIDFIKSPFLVQEWKIADKAGTRRETLRLDMIQGSSRKYHDADIIIFNTGHWWTHQKTYKGNNYFQEGNHVYTRLEVADAYTRALKTWAQWVDSHVNPSRTRVFFRGYSASHFKGGQWQSGGNCDGETEPITNETHLAPYPWMMSILESVIAEMKTPVFYLNVTRMTDYRKDGHPSIFRPAKVHNTGRNTGMIQDCSHWCLPGVPDTWNELLFATLLTSHHSALN
ncbi:hypothetical protein RJ640_014723 [Escallonia rubra]|uniref:Trichome birefringence-like N-terminal domain-containing protein n=1 Tax=Escallonia rubra TaxID=112253 RepID=A0AA88UQ56_9ASTE|nr:hypothetical protein RJ640_014723 [Escallonia rubra]